MKFRSKSIRVLLSLYPATWRKEYGAELEGVLQIRPLSAVVIADVVLSAGWQRLRLAEPWKICGLVLFAWSSFWITWNSIAPLSFAAYERYAEVQRPLWLLTIFGAGLWTSMRGEKPVSKAASAAVKAAMLGILPDLIILALNVVGILPHVLLDVNTRHQPGGLRAGASGAIVILPFVVLAAAWLVGLCGAVIGRFYGSTRYRIRQS